MTIQYLGHSCFLIHLKGKSIIVDPFISGNPKAADFDPDQLPVDYVLLTHGHADHVLDAERILKRTGATLISSFEITEWYGEKGFSGHGMNIGGSYNFDFGQIRAVTAIHSSNLPDGSYGGNPMGFVISNDEACFYIARDTALTMDMKLIPIICLPLDFAILPIGDNFTMGYKDVPLAAEFIQCKKIIGCHFDTFGVIEVDHEAVLQFFKENHIDGKLMSIGEVTEI